PAPAPSLSAPPPPAEEGGGVLIDQPTGAATVGPVPPAATLDPQKTLRIVADRVRSGDSGPEKGRVIGEGNVQLDWRGYRVTCQRATYDPETRIATFETNVVLETGTQTVYADGVTLNLRTQEFRSVAGRTIVPPSLLGPNLVEPLRISGREVTREGDITTARDGFLTTCDFPNPHYKIGFRQATVIPRRRIVLRDATFYRYDKPIFRVRYLALPITDRISYSYLPLVGRNNEEGFFLKTALAYTGSQRLPEGIVRLDLMEKKGIGLGIDQAYRLGRDALGSLILYSLRDQGRNVNNLNGRLNHQQRIGTVRLGITSDFQNNSYNSVSSESQTQISTITATRSVGPSTTNVTLNLGSNSFGSDSTSNNTAYSLQQTQALGGGSNVTLRLNGRNNESNNLLSRNLTTEQLGDLRATGKAGIFDVSLAANKNFLSRSTTRVGDAAPVNNNYFGGTERLPDVSLSTDSQRIGGFLRAVPTRFTVGLGQFVDGSPNARVATNRALFDLNTTPRPFSLSPGGRLSLQTSGGFRQTLYTSDAAQYVLTNQVQLTQRFSTIDSLNFTYGYLRPYGGQPLGFRYDQTGSNNNLGANYSLEGGSVKATLLTGYDLQRAGQSNLTPGTPRNPWQNLSAQLALRASDVFQTRFTASYDWNRGKLLDATNRFRVRAFNGPALDTSVRYDPNRSRFSQIAASLQTPLFSRDVNFIAYASYDGISRRYQNTNFSLTRSFHDYELTFNYTDQPYGFRTQKGFTVSFRLKALPTFAQTPGGQYGTGLDVGSGPIF
ncbi:MAG: LPS-assembly protein LptD, partial [Cytophagales bacterium]|nr:LPS-assembly protein LptD [Armatimonadota bacterium]